MWIIEFQASGMDQRSYPIEVAITNGTKEFCALIKPLSKWSFWDEETEHLHHISRDILKKHGKNPLDVANTLNRLLGNHVVHCESDGWDAFWCQVLFSDSGVEQLFDIRSLFPLMNHDRKLTLYLAAKRDLESCGYYLAKGALRDAQIIHKALSLILDQDKGQS